MTKIGTTTRTSSRKKSRALGGVSLLKTSFPAPRVRAISNKLICSSSIWKNKYSKASNSPNRIRTPSLNLSASEQKSNHSQKAERIRNGNAALKCSLISQLPNSSANCQLRPCIASYSMIRPAKINHSHPPIHGQRVAGLAAASDGAGAVRTAARAVLDGEPEIALDYVALIDPGSAQEVARGYRGDAILAVAARVGTTRLIDNTPLVVSGSGGTS